jgi:hypothetical protein
MIKRPTHLHLPGHHALLHGAPAHQAIHAHGLDLSE